MKATSRDSVRFSYVRGVEPGLIGPARAVSPAAPPAIAIKRTILLVDDHPVVREMFASFLRGLGYGVLEAHGPIEAQEMADGPVKIDLLMTDFRMPQMNGIQLARWFHGRFPTGKVLVISSTPWEVEPYFSKSDGFVLLEKSEAFARLAGVVTELLAQTPAAAPGVQPIPSRPIP